MKSLRKKAWKKAVIGEKNYYSIGLAFSVKHYESVSSIIEPSGYTVSQLFKLAIQEYLDENYVEESGEPLESENAGD